MVATFASAGIEEVLRTGRAAQKYTGAVLVFASAKDRQFAAFCSDKQCDIRPLLTAAFEKAGGKGGGGPSFFQGRFTQAAELAAFVNDVKKMAGNALAAAGETL